MPSARHNRRLESSVYEVKQRLSIWSFLVSLHSVEPFLLHSSLDFAKLALSTFSICTAILVSFSLRKIAIPPFSADFFNSASSQAVNPILALAVPFSSRNTFSLAVEIFPALS